MNTDKKWFVRRRYGWGWTPATWQAWLTLAVWLGFVTIISFFLPTSPYFSPLLILSTLILVWISYKTGETPRWQWGKKK